MNKKNIVSFSGGKDSTTMLLMMIEKNMRIDEIIFADNGVEFPETYKHIDKVENYISRKIKRVSAKYNYVYYATQYKKENGGIGFGWANIKHRRCTGIKISTINKYLKNKYGDEDYTQYIGIAFDEKKRIKPNKKEKKAYPLVEWEITEKGCLEYCYNKGFTWNGLYEIFDRVSCYCCPFKKIRELKSIYEIFPELWNKIKKIDKGCYNDFRSDYTLDQLEQKFKNEIQAEKEQGELF